MVDTPLHPVHSDNLETHDYHKGKVISSTGVNAAYLHPGEFAISLAHSFCALIVLSNGKESVVAHLSTPTGPEELQLLLEDIRHALGGHVTATFYQAGVGDNTATDEQKKRLGQYMRALEGAIGKENIISERVMHGGRLHQGNYFISARGVIEPLANHSLVQLERAFLQSGETFGTLHKTQPVMATQTVASAAGPTTLLLYSDIPPFLQSPSTDTAEPGKRYTQQIAPRTAPHKRDPLVKDDTAHGLH